MIPIRIGCDIMEHSVTYGIRYGSHGCMTIRDCFLTDARLVAIRKYIRLVIRNGTEDEIINLLEMIRLTEIEAKRRVKIEGYVNELRGG